MAIFGIRKKAKETLKNILGFQEESSENKVADPKVQIKEEIFEKPEQFDPPAIDSFEQKNQSEEETSKENEERSQTSDGNDNIDEGLPLTRENVQEVFDDYIRPGLQSDGGDITLIKIEENDIYVKLVGACSTCPSSVMTMKMGVEALLQEEFPTMRELIDITSEENT
jgi:Fe-S cluster biogenesis protein NfuA